MRFDVGGSRGIKVLTLGGEEGGLISLEERDKSFYRWGVG